MHEAERARKAPAARNEETMSRIHEALKRAAQERASHLPGTAVPDLADVAVEVRRSDEVSPVLPQSPATAPSYAEGESFLRFDNLVQRCAHPAWHPNLRSSVFSASDGNRVGAERFRTLRSRLYQMAATQQMRRLLITSSLPAEGKTFVAANLAQSIVRQPDRRVLLIDADLRASKLHVALGAPGTPGLTDYLRGEADEFSVIQKSPDSNLCLIPGGHEVSNPSELLLSERLKHLLDLVTPLFDWVILDSPPALPVHDASMLADLCDGTLFVVHAGVTDYEVADKAASEFREKNLLGVVLNRLDKMDSSGTYYYYSYYPSEEKQHGKT